MFQFKNFALRDADTKACSRAEKKVLNQDWREDDEIDSEWSEVTSINDKVVFENVTSSSESHSDSDSKKTPKKESKPDSEKTAVEKAIEDSEKRAKEKHNEETEEVVLFLVEDFEDIDDDLKAEIVVQRTRDHLNGHGADSDNKAVRTIIITHKNELNAIKPSLADECMKLLAEGK